MTPGEDGVVVLFVSLVGGGGEFGGCWWGVEVFEGLFGGCVVGVGYFYCVVCYVVVSGSGSKYVVVRAGADGSASV